MAATSPGQWRAPQPESAGSSGEGSSSSQSELTECSCLSQERCCGEYDRKAKVGTERGESAGLSSERTGGTTAVELELAMEEMESEVEITTSEEEATSESDGDDEDEEDEEEVDMTEVEVRGGDPVLTMPSDEVTLIDPGKLYREIKLVVFGSKIMTPNGWKKGNGSFLGKTLHSVLQERNRQDENFRYRVMLSSAKPCVNTSPPIRYILSKGKKEVEKRLEDRLRRSRDRLESLRLATSMPKVDSRNWTWIRAESTRKAGQEQRKAKTAMDIQMHKKTTDRLQNRVLTTTSEYGKESYDMSWKQSLEYLRKLTEFPLHWEAEEDKMHRVEWARAEIGNFWHKASMVMQNQFPLCFLEVSAQERLREGGEPRRRPRGRSVLGKVVVELRPDMAPMASFHFLLMCMAKEDGQGLRNAPIDRIIPTVMLQAKAGEDGGGIHPYGLNFPGDGYRLKHAAPGTVSLGVHPEDNGRCRIMVTMKCMPGLDGTHIVMGRVARGMDIIRKLSDMGKFSGRPSRDIFISDCGQTIPANLIQNFVYNPVEHKEVRVIHSRPVSRTPSSILSPISTPEFSHTPSAIPSTSSSAAPKSESSSVPLGEEEEESSSLHLEEEVALRKAKSQPIEVEALPEHDPRKIKSLAHMAEDGHLPLAASPPRPHRKRYLSGLARARREAKAHTDESSDDDTMTESLAKSAATYTLPTHDSETNRSILVSEVIPTPTPTTTATTPTSNLETPQSSKSNNPWSIPAPSPKPGPDPTGRCDGEFASFGGFVGRPPSTESCNKSLPDSRPWSQADSLLRVPAALSPDTKMMPELRAYSPTFDALFGPFPWPLSPGPGSDHESCSTTSKTVTVGSQTPDAGDAMVELPNPSKSPEE